MRYSDVVTLESPIRVTLPRVKVKDKVMPLNLNNYRNNHHAINNDIKQRYNGLMEQLVIETFSDVKIVGPIRVDYELFVGTRRLLDISNVLSIVDKCFMDVLVKVGVIEDDNFDHVVEVRYLFGGYEKGEERVGISIHFNNQGEET